MTAESCRGDSAGLKNVNEVCLPVSSCCCRKKPPLLMVKYCRKFCNVSSSSSYKYPSHNLRNSHSGQGRHCEKNFFQAFEAFVVSGETKVAVKCRKRWPLWHILNLQCPEQMVTHTWTNVSYTHHQNFNLICCMLKIQPIHLIKKYSRYPCESLSFTIYMN